MIELAASAFLAMCVASDGDSGTCDQIGRYRIVDIDTPEIHGKCPAEIAGAQVAKAFAIEFMREPVLVHHDGKRDKYRRLLVRITHPVRGDLGQALVRAGLARPYDGGRRGNWCEVK